MPMYCNAGDTANIAISTGENLSFEDTPVDIQFEENPDTTTWDTSICRNYRINYRFNRKDGNSPTEIRTNFINSAGLYGGIRVVNGAGSPNPNQLQIFARPQYNCSSNGQWMLVSNNAAWVTLSNPEVTSIVVTSTNTTLTPIIIPGRKYLKIFGASGALLFTKEYTGQSKPTYTVDCVNCPPGTLSCGDCCLSCDEVRNKISQIRAILARIN